MNIFQLGKFILHSGAESKWKIECDELQFSDWAALAQMLVEQLPPFSEVFGVPRGGIKLAEALNKYRTIGLPLIVDDVLTTGNSMVKFRDEYKLQNAMGAVIFARGETLDWVYPLFQMKPYIRK